MLESLSHGGVLQNQNTKTPRRKAPRRRHHHMSVCQEGLADEAMPQMR